LYDAFGRRETFDDLGVVESYLYDSLQAVQTSNPSQNFFTAPDGEVLAYSSSSGTFVPLTDVLGSTIALTDSGKLYTQYKYEPFGVPSTIGESSNYPYLFAGMEYDPTGLYHTWARYYSPRLQRFSQEDPLQYGGGDINLFAYTGNDPVNLRDPHGTFLIAPVLLAAFTGGAFGAVMVLATNPNAGVWAVAKGFGIGFVSAGLGSVFVVGAASGWALSLPARLALSGLGAAFGSTFGRAIQGKSFSLTQTSLAFGAGVTGSAAGWGAAGSVAAAGEGSVASDLPLISQAWGSSIGGFLKGSFGLLAELRSQQFSVSAPAVAPPSGVSPGPPGSDVSSESAQPPPPPGYGPPLGVPSHSSVDAAFTGSFGVGGLPL
jgi:RHS repeat-associated protein